MNFFATPLMNIKMVSIDLLEYKPIPTYDSLKASNSQSGQPICHNLKHANLLLNPEELKNDNQLIYVKEMEELYAARNPYTDRENITQFNN